MRILIIDDEASLLFAMHDYLTRDGFDVECALELEEAQALLSNLVFDAVITDIRLTAMQNMDGLQILSFLRQRGSNTRAIVVTAYVTPQLVAEAERLGAERVLRKPAALAELATVLRATPEVAQCS